MTPIRRGAVRSRPGLTLVETLAAVALLAMIAAACAAAFRELLVDAERRFATDGLLFVGSAGVVAEALLDDPGRLGLSSLHQIGDRPRVLTPDPELRAKLEPLLNPAFANHDAQDQPVRIRAWRVFSRASSVDRLPAEPPRPARGQGPAPCWLVIDSNGDAAFRCVLLPPEPGP